MQVELAARRALGEHDAGPYSPTTGCFDRRYWAWKITDFPEATFQRLTLPLALLYRDPYSSLHRQPEVLEAVRAGLAYTVKIQHHNGAFDQAFPFEQSYGATAFLLYPVLEATALVGDDLGDGGRAGIERTASRAARFLCAHDERHGVITNHLAGAALALIVAAEWLGDSSFERGANVLLDRVLASQSAEGWFPEYGGADPGYQTLCLDYLSAIAARRPSAALEDALARSLNFLQWFVHPDGTFGGSYGSRRTGLVYLGGLARLASRSAVASALMDTTGAAMARADITGPSTIDIGNLAPLLTSTVTALRDMPPDVGRNATLPYERADARVDFLDAGIHVRAARPYYAVCGASNGGTVSVFSRDARRLLLEDGGYVGALSDGGLVTTQVTDCSRRARIDGSSIEIDTLFFRMPTTVPTPAKFVVLRLLNLTVMRSIAIGNWVKRRLVRLLIARGAEVPLRLVRRISFGEAGVEVHDRIENPTGLALHWMIGGRPFSGIHMASAGYFQGARLGASVAATAVDVQRLARERVIELRRTI